MRGGVGSFMFHDRIPSHCGVSPTGHRPGRARPGSAGLKIRSTALPPASRVSSRSRAHPQLPRPSTEAAVASVRTRSSDHTQGAGILKHLDPARLDHSCCLGYLYNELSKETSQPALHFASTAPQKRPHRRPTQKPLNAFIITTAGRRSNIVRSCV